MKRISFRIGLAFLALLISRPVAFAIAFPPVTGSYGQNYAQSQPMTSFSGNGLGFGMNNQISYYNPYGRGTAMRVSNITPYGSFLQASDNYSSIFGSGSTNTHLSFPGYLINTYGPNGSGSSTLTSSSPGFGNLNSAFGRTNVNTASRVSTPSRSNNSSCFDSDDFDDFEDEWNDNLDDLVEDLEDDIDDGSIDTISELSDEQDDFEDDFDDELQDALDDACDNDDEDDLDDFEDDFLDDVRREFNSLRASL